MFRTVVQDLSTTANAQSVRDSKHLLLLLASSVTVKTFVSVYV